MMWSPFGPKYPERHPEDVDTREYDYVIVGAGTAGCALASRLSEDPDVSVLVLERGPVNDTWMSRIPLASSDIWTYEGGSKSWNCEPMKYCDDRQSLFFRAEIMGGGSRINGMVYTRGSAADYDGWAASGHPEWSYEKVLPYFVRGETSLDHPKSSYRGHSGPWITKSFTYFSWLFRGYKVFAKCAEVMGFVHIADTSAPDAPADGLATHDVTVNAKNQRVSTFDAFLPRQIALARKNLTICTKVIVSQISFRSEEKDSIAEQVLFRSTDPKSNKVYAAKVNKEVIVCSGSIGSPQVLMLSGIGPAKHLGELGIEVVHDLAGVGSELTDHIGFPVVWEVPLSESLAAVATSPLIKGLLEFLKYLFFGIGILSQPMLSTSLFVRSTSLNKDATGLRDESPSKEKGNIASRPQDNIPDIELMPIGFSAIDDLEDHQRHFSKIGVFSILATLQQPKSRGTVRLASSNPHDRPKIDFGFLSNPADLTLARTAIRLSLKLGEAMKESGFPLLRNLVYPEEKQEIDIKNNTDDEMDKFIRRRARTTYHYACTCRMAPKDDAEAPGVVDDHLRVHGVRNLRVCDTSVFPKIVSSHLQAPAVMVAERCAEWIQKDAVRIGLRKTL